MNKHAFIILIFALLMAVSAGTAKEMSGGDEPSMEEMTARWQKVATPGEHHKTLDYFVGEWDFVTRMWMAGPGQPPSEATGKASSKWIMDGRYVETNSTSEMMGMSYRSRALIGYDNYRMKYISTWLDNMSTTVSSFSGVYDSKAKVYRFFGEMDEPMTGEIAKPIWGVYRIVDKDTHVFEAHDSIYGEGETKVMELTFKRRK